MKKQLRLVPDLNTVRGDADLKAGNVLLAWIRARSVCDAGTAHMGAHFAGMADIVPGETIVYRVVP